MSHHVKFDKSPGIDAGLTGWWADRGRCRGQDPKQFHAPFGEDAAGRLIRENDVKSRYCTNCEVVDQCRDWAREHREYGVWGGESEIERAAAGFAPALSRLPRRQAVSEPE